MPKITRAIVSVTDKTGIVEFCKTLVALQIEILSTGGTAKVLREHQIPVRDVAEYTGFPEILDGRLKTLHPLIEGGILGIRKNKEHQAQMARQGIAPIDMVVVNLYAFEKTVAGGSALHEAIENIDIGGPTMLRAAAKNWQDVTVVVDPADYKKIASELAANQGVIAEQTNFDLMIKTFQRTAAYDAAISAYLASQSGGESKTWPQHVTLQFEKIQDLRYGENPHQAAAVYQQIPATSASIAAIKQLHGKELSFNNFIDLEAAYNCVKEFAEPASVIIKHTNPCGVALGKDLVEAFLRARASDPVSAFGGILGFNRRLDQKTAEAIGETFFECILAPGFDDAALAFLKSKKNLRLMVMTDFAPGGKEWDFKKISGGLLLQDGDDGSVDLKTCQVPTKRKPTADELAELAFAWKIAKHVKSNAIVFTKNRQVLGVGAGQMSRVDSTRIAAMKAQQPLAGSVAASDAFFPFRDGLDEIAGHKISAIVQPGGSVKDAEVIKAADEHGLAMVLTGMRHFRH